MSDEATRPAMTPEAWASVLSSGELPARRARRLLDWHGDHEMAALCLYGQPFGFTQEDVRILTEQRDMLMSVRHGDPGSSHARWLTSLAARIAALLPPPS